MGADLRKRIRGRDSRPLCGPGEAALVKKRRTRAGVGVAYLWGHTCQRVLTRASDVARTTPRNAESIGCCVEPGAYYLLVFFRTSSHCCSTGKRRTTLTCKIRVDLIVRAMTPNFNTGCTRSHKSNNPQFLRDLEFGPRETRLSRLRTPARRPRKSAVQSPSPFLPTSAVCVLSRTNFFPALPLILSRKRDMLVI